MKVSPTAPSPSAREAASELVPIVAAISLQSSSMAHLLKLLGMPKDPLPEIWWRERPEIRERVFFGRRPNLIRPGDRLIYYAIGGDGKCVAEAEVTGEATQNVPVP